MKKLLLFLLLIPNLVMAEIWTYSDASGFWSSPTAELSINSEDLLVNVQISCANFYKQPRLRTNIHYEGYDWDEIKGEFTVILKDNHEAAILKKFDGGQYSGQGKLTRNGEVFEGTFKKNKFVGSE